MNKNIKKIDRYLKGVVPPEHTSHQHRQQLRREVLEKIERRQNMSVRMKSWKVAAVIAVVTGLGAVSVVGVTIGRYYYFGKNDDGVHTFVNENHDSIVIIDGNEITDVEQTRRDLEEIERLRQQDKRELLQVEKIMTDGTLDLRVHVYKYELSDGRTIDIREGAGGTYTLGKARLQEFRQLCKARQGEDLGTYEEVVEDRVFSFKRERYILSDGTEVIYSIGKPK